MPQTTVTYTVSFDHTRTRWYAHVCGHTTTGEGEVLEHGNVHREFGPFDGSLDVARWLVAEMHAQTKVQANRDNLTC